MTREYREAIKRFMGDPKLAIQYTPVARTILGGLIQQLRLGGIEYGHRIVNLPDGAMIRVIHNSGINTIEIDVSVPTEKKKSFIKPYGFCFYPKTLLNTRGWVYADGEIVDNPKNGYRAYYGDPDLNCFGAAVYTGIDETGVKVTGKFGVGYISGNQFFIHNEDVYSWVHSAGGDLPIPGSASGLYIPYLSINSTGNRVMWRVSSTSAFSVPNGIFKNGSMFKIVPGLQNKNGVVLGISMFNGQLIVVYSLDLRSIAVDGAVASNGSLFTDAIYGSGKDTVLCLNGKAFFSDDGSRFSVISRHTDKSVINEYLLEIDKEKGIVCTKQEGVEFPPATVTITTQNAQNYSGDEYMQYSVLPDLIIDKNPSPPGCISQGRYGPIPEAVTKSGSGQILVSKITTTISEEPVAVIYDGVVSKPITLRYNATVSDVGESKEETNGTDKMVLWQDTLCREYWHPEMDSIKTITQSSDEANTVSAGFYMGGTLIYDAINQDVSELLSQKVEQHRYTLFNQYGEETIYNITKNNTSRVISHTPLFIDFKTMRRIEYVYDYNWQFTETSDRVHYNPVIAKPDEVSQSYSETKKITYTLNLVQDAITDLYSHEVDESKSGNGTILNPFALPTPPHNVPAVSSSASAVSQTASNFVQQYTKNIYGPATLVYDDRPSVKTHSLFMYDILFTPVDNPADTKKYYFHGDAFGGVVDKLPFDTSEVFSHVVGLF